MPPLLKCNMDQKPGEERDSDGYYGNAYDQGSESLVGRNTREHGKASHPGHGEASGNHSENQRSLTEDERTSNHHHDRHNINSRHHWSYSRRHSNGGGGGGHKKKLRSCSDSVRDPNSFVDTSLDDDCPGVPENRIRRSRHQHQHYVCRQCLEELGSKGWGKSKMAKKGWCRKHSPEQETVHSSGSGCDHSGAPVGPALVVSLDQVHTLERSTEMTAEDSGNDERVRQVAAASLQKVGGADHLDSSRVIRTSQTKHHHSRKKNGAWTHHVGKDHQEHNHKTLNSAPGSLQDDEPEEHGMTDMSVIPSRSGRDSPATDMAVCCLDLDSPRMLQPQDHQNQQLTGLEDGYHLYYHQHFHHIIHHSQP